MSDIQHLEEQAARAERLAPMVDGLSMERLRAFAAECRQQIEALTTGRPLTLERDKPALR